MQEACRAGGTQAAASRRPGVVGGGWGVCQQSAANGPASGDRAAAFPALFRKTIPGPSAPALPQPSHNLNNLETE